MAIAEPIVRVVPRPQSHLIFEVLDFVDFAPALARRTGWGDVWC